MIKKHRCKWVNLNNPLYVAYHDTEWGNPVFDDHCLFEMLILESFQAGLSWECVLNKRKDFKIAFDNFELNKVINYDDNKIAELLSNEKIIRNRLKIKAAINNAKIFKEIQKETKSFSNYLWHWTDYKIIHETGKTSSALSDAISKDLQKRGMKFVGTTIIYSYLQAVGVINSHEKDCFLAPQIR
ncbi:DNA-3-methyladenine glycosylase I [Succinatimonas hippei]|uniref:DNA-3-methyladenine glycosylase I n=1 Tax=Succinatimonas hippei TaxID=626938 RepID=UPI0023F8F7D7|nr:DNA-3-methyladenine glycosylase I [Succinatimonas hippei]